MIYKFTIPFTPRGKKNSRPIFVNKKTGKHFLGKDAGLKKYEDDCLWVLTSQKNAQKITKPIEGDLKVRCWFRFKGACRSDIDNLQNGLFDALQKAGIILNDKQIKFSDHIQILEQTGLPDETVIHIDLLNLPGCR